MTQRLTRRDFLRTVSLSLLTPPFARPAWKQRSIRFYGRVIFVYATLYERPSVYAPTRQVYKLETVLPIYAEVMGEDEQAYNKRWYETEGGYIHSTNVQPVLNQPNAPRRVETPQLGEVTIPATEARALPSPEAEKIYRLYYGSTHWIRQSLVGTDGEAWYALWDDRYQRLYFCPAVAIRLIPGAELGPISPQVADKQIVIDTLQQTITALENGRSVFATRMSSGGQFTDPASGESRDFRTPLGRYTVFHKRPSRHMTAGDGAAADSYDLPGVPWVSYFNGGIALHGTYWHNDYGRPWSHGCINLLPQDARWFYRWTTPHVPFEAETFDGDGTSITVQ